MRTRVRARVFLFAPGGREHYYRTTNPAPSSSANSGGGKKDSALRGPREFADVSTFNVPNGADERRRRAAPGRVDVSDAAHRGVGRRKRCLRPHARLRHQICEARRVVRKILGVPPALVPADSMRKKLFE